MTTNYPLTIDEFRNWLKSKSENEVVGITITIDRCPIANFFKECRNYTGRVEVDCYTTETEEGVVYTNPSWVISFVLNTDDAFDKELTAKRALMWIE